MGTENMIESGAGESSPQNKRAHREKKTWRAAEDLKSAALGLADDYTEKASKALDEAKDRVGALRDNGEDYVRQNPMKAVFAAFGVGFILGFIFRHSAPRRT